jgi:hypothetical protein
MKTEPPTLKPRAPPNEAVSSLEPAGFKGTEVLIEVFPEWGGAKAGKKQIPASGEASHARGVIKFSLAICAPWH